VDTFLRALIEGLLVGGVYALIVLGVVVVCKATQIVNLAYGGIMTFLTYLIYWLLVPVGLPLPAALIIMVLAAALIGLAIERFMMRPLIGRPEAALVTFIATLILGFQVIKGFSILLFKGKPEVLPPMFIFPGDAPGQEGTITIGSMTFSYIWLIAAIIGVAMFILFVLYFRLTKSGLAMRCVSEDHVISQSLGINVKRIFQYAWIVGAISAGIAGLLWGKMFAVESEMGGLAMMRALPVLLLAGLTSLPGAFIGAIGVGLTESLAGTYIDPHVTGFREVLPYILMVAILIILPNGLFGTKMIRRI